MGLLQRIFKPRLYEEAIKANLELDVDKQVKQALTKIFTPTSEQLWFGSLSGTSEAPARGTEELFEAYRRSPRFKAIVHKISNYIGSVPWLVGTATNGKGQPVKCHELQYAPTMETRHIALRKLMDNQQFKPLLKHPISKIINDGNDIHTGLQMRKITQVMIDCKGDVYWWLRRNGSAVPTYAYVIPPHWVQETPTEVKPYYRLSWGSLQEYVQPEEMLAFADLNPLNPYGRGIGIGEALGDEIDGDEYAAKFIKSAMYNRAVPVGMMHLEGAGDPEVRQFEESWKGKHLGAYRAGTMHFTGGPGEIKYTRIENTFEELQLLGLRDQYAKLLVETFGIPPELLGRIENSNRATIDASMHLFDLTVAIPRLEFLRDIFQNKLAPLFDDRLIVDYISPVSADKAYQLEVMKAAPHTFTQGEWRQQAGFEHRGKQDEIQYTPLNLLPESQGVQKDGQKQDKIMVQKINPVDNVLEALRPERIIDEMTPIWEEEVEEWGNIELNNLGITASFNMLNPLVRQHVYTELGDRIKDLVDETTKKALRETMMEGIQRGEGVRELRERIHDVFLEGGLDIYDVRANRIARTEVGISANFAKHNAMQQSMVVERRKWITAFINSRKEHKALHGTEVGINEPFTYGGDSAMYPGAWEKAKMNVNCLCTTVAVISEPLSDIAIPLASIEWNHKRYTSKHPIMIAGKYNEEQLEAIWKAFVEQTEPWIGRATKAIERGLRKQMEDVIDALERILL